MKELFYHELTHAAHYNALGNGWYTAFVSNEAFEIIQNLSSGYAPYGDGTNINSPQIALGEGWAYYIGHIFADMQYNTHADCSSEQKGADGYGIPFCPDGNNHPHLLVEENFNPNLSSDPFKWIPKGLFYDLFDVTNENFPIVDQVSNYSNQMLFSAFQSSIYTLQDYKAKLIQLNPNNQTTQVTNLFNQYHY